PAAFPATEVERMFFDRTYDGARHQGYPVLDANGRILGVITRSNLIEFSGPDDLRGLIAADLVGGPPIVAFADESCRTAAERLATGGRAGRGVGSRRLVPRADPDRLVGMVTRSDLLKARERWLELEHRRERLLQPSWWRAQRQAAAMPDPAIPAANPPARSS